MAIAFASNSLNSSSIPGPDQCAVLSHSTTKSYNEPFRYLAERFNPCHGNLCDKPLSLPTARFPKPFGQAFFAICVFLCSIYGVSIDSNKDTVGEECGLWTRVFHAKGVSLVEVGLT
ncbi:hypothetical protein AVEN_122499-1 [Araneus ventricosus]|uniref:Uncharacterized protein n=1 Tax=Araneus ventricosus TaxID=182803 RepID=A0A4Y1ZLA2_ARAVE|nr:hypothetical protein AVEN_122499-1 [Araneus ventricosus]